jgi:hypothetical protein
MTVSTALQTELDAWLAPFLARLRRSEQRRWAPLSWIPQMDWHSAGPVRQFRLVRQYLTLEQVAES